MNQSPVPVPGYSHSCPEASREITSVLPSPLKSFNRIDVAGTAGVTSFDAADRGLVPPALTASTWKL